MQWCWLIFEFLNDLRYFGNCPDLSHMLRPFLETSGQQSRSGQLGGFGGQSQNHQTVDWPLAHIPTATLECNWVNWGEKICREVGWVTMGEEKPSIHRWWGVGEGGWEGGWVPSGGSIEERLAWGRLQCWASSCPEDTRASSLHPPPDTRFARHHLFQHLWSAVDLTAGNGIYLEGNAD